MKRVLLFVFLTFTTITNAFADDHIRCRTVSDKWVWFEDHLFLYVNYKVKGPDGRKYKVGTGMKISGKPRGRRQTLSGESSVLALGAGAVHIKKADLGEPFTVCVTSDSNGKIPLSDLVPRPDGF